MGSENTSLQLASALGQESDVNILLKQGTPIDNSNELGWTALMQAARNGHTSIVEILIACGANIFLINRYGANLLSLAAASNNLATILAVIRAMSKQVPDFFLISPMSVATLFGNSPAVGLLLGNGYDPNASSSLGLTPLMMATVTGDATVARLLIQYGAQVDSVNCSNESAIDLAVSCGHQDIKSLFINTFQEYASKLQEDSSPGKYVTLNRSLPSESKYPNVNQNDLISLKRKLISSPFSETYVVGKLMKLSPNTGANTDSHADSNGSTLPLTSPYQHKIFQLQQFTNPTVVVQSPRATYTNKRQANLRAQKCSSDIESRGSPMNKCSPVVERQKLPGISITNTTPHQFQLLSNHLPHSLPSKLTNQNKFSFCSGKKFQTNESTKFKSSFTKNTSFRQLRFSPERTNFPLNTIDQNQSSKQYRETSPWMSTVTKKVTHDNYFNSPHQLHSSLNSLPRSSPSSVNTNSKSSKRLNLGTKRSTIWDTFKKFKSPKRSYSPRTAARSSPLYKENDTNSIDKLLDMMDLQEFCHLFKQHEIDTETFLMLNEDDLEEIGIKNRDVKKIILNKIHNFIEK